MTAEEAYRSICINLGPDICKILDSDGWSDLEINPDGKVFLDTDECREIQIEYDADELYSAGYVLASYLGKEFNGNVQCLDGVIPTTAIRAHFVVPPYVDRIAADFRRLNTKHFTPDDMVEMGVIKKEDSDRLIKAIRGEDDETGRPKNIVFAGATGSGKTTMMNAYLTQVQMSHRVITIEDTKELQVIQPNKLQGLVNAEFSYEKAIAEVLRETPNRIIVGEMRYGEQCLQTLKLWNTGHSGGMTTIHANSCEDVILRMRQLCQEVSQMPADELDRVIKSIIDVIVFTQRIPGSTQRIVKEIVYNTEEL